MAVIFHRLAAQEFVRARRWYGRRSAQAESRFVAAVADALHFIEANPLLALAYQGNHRWQRVRRFPYVLFSSRSPPGPFMSTPWPTPAADRGIGCVA
jgi:hypothetical protein